MSGQLVPAILLESLAAAAMPLNDEQAPENLEEKLVGVIQDSGLSETTNDILTKILEQVRSYVNKAHTAGRHLWKEHNEFLLALRRLLGIGQMKDEEEENRETVAA